MKYYLAMKKDWILEYGYMLQGGGTSTDCAK